MVAKQIDDFVGIFTTKEVIPQTSGDDKIDYYADAETVVISMEKVEGHRPGNPGVAASEQVIRGKVIDGEWGGQTEFEDAIFYFRGGMLISDPIKTDVPGKPNPGRNDLWVTEVVSLHKSNDGKILSFTLFWSDGDFGSWRCGGN